MIIRPSQKSKSTSLVSVSQLSHLERILQTDEFSFEIAKEISRSNRRNSGREFSVIRFPGLDIVRDEESCWAVVSNARLRIRISDTFGTMHNQLALLLPETDREGSMALANELSIMLGDEQPLDTEVAVYPWDDELISLTDELNQEQTADSGQPFDQVGIADNSHDAIDHKRDSKNDGQQVSDSNRDAQRAADRPALFTHCVKTPWWKRAIDIAGSGAGMIVLSPVLLGAAVAIKINSPGPVFFRQMREGKEGRIFGILKFRTMVVDAESLQDDLRGQSEQDGPAFKIEQDPRVTTVGKYLRKSCVDELPQLVNILMGQMSLVGPRPLPVGESYGCKAWHRARLTVLPGLTCIWQTRDIRDVKFDEWMRMDLDYIKRRSFLFDLKLIFKTARLALLHRGSA